MHIRGNVSADKYTKLTTIRNGGHLLLMPGELVASAPRPGLRQNDGTLNWHWEGTSRAEGLLDVKQAISDLKAVGYDRPTSMSKRR